MKAPLAVIVLTIQVVFSIQDDMRDSSSCDWESRSNLYAIRAILDNIIRENDTLLYELAGIFSNKQRPLRQVIVHYSIMIPLNEDCDDNDLHCDYLQYNNSINTGGDCPQGYRCIKTDFIWGRFPATAQDLIFRNLDACPLVIGDYEQREVNIYFNLTNPPSCDKSVIDVKSIERQEFPCGWQCNILHTLSPSNGDPSSVIVRAVERESPLDGALTRITAKLLQYSTDKEALPTLQYDITMAAGYAAKLGDVTYFNPTVEYTIFLLAYSLMHAIVFMVIVHYRLEIYTTIYEYVTKSHVNFSLFWSFVVTFFLFCFNISFVFAVEGGVCITLLQLYIFVISLAPGLFYPFVAIFMIKRKHGFFNAALALQEDVQPVCVQVPCLDQFVQILILWFIYILPHVSMLIFLLTLVSFFFNSNGTTFLALYFASSSVILWIANAIVIFLISRIFSCQEKPIVAVKRIVFAICLGLSVNLMNLSVIPFIGDFFYDKRADGSTVFSLIPLVITFVGWYLSGELVEGLSSLPFTDKFTEADEIKPEGEKEEEVGFKRRIVNRLTLKRVRKNLSVEEGGTNGADVVSIATTNNGDAERSSYPKIRGIAKAFKLIRQATIQQPMETTDMGLEEVQGGRNGQETTYYNDGVGNGDQETAIEIS